MGNSNGCEGNSNENFNPSRYITPGVSETDVIGIHRIFESLNPKQGFVKVEEIKILYKNCFDSEFISNAFGSRIYVNFDEFYDVMCQNILDKRSKFRDTEFDSASNVSCFFCPYSVQKYEKNRIQY